MKINKWAAHAAAGALFCASVFCVYEVTSVEKAAATPKAVKAETPAKVEAPAKKTVVAYHKDIPLSADLQMFLRQQCELNNVPYVLALAVCEQESRFDINADGGDSYGLMQINEIHGAREIIIEPRENIKIGTWLLGYLWREYRDWNKALTAYNCGEAGAEKMYFRHGSISSPYSREVMLRSQRFAEMLGEDSVLMPK